MSDQTSIPVDGSQPDAGPCAWCGSSTTNKLVTAKGGLQTQHNGVKTRQPDKWAWCCDDHMRSLHRNNHDTNPAPGVAIK